MFLISGFRAVVSYFLPVTQVAELAGREVGLLQSMDVQNVEVTTSLSCFLLPIRYFFFSDTLFDSFIFIKN